MAEKAFFYNALPDESSVTGYDRNYNADDLSDWLATVWETGVVKSDEGLKVVASSGMTVNVNAGKACILGKPYNNTSMKALTVGTAPTGSTARYDLVVLQYNNETHTRHTRLLIKQNSAITGLSTDEDIESLLIRSGKVFEICLAIIVVQPNATSITQSDIYDRRGNAKLCPWFTAVKGYDDYYDAMVQSFEYNETLASATKTVTTNLASKLFNDVYSQIEVYTNGLKEPSSAYTIASDGANLVIEFTTQRSAGAKINVVLDNYIDGEGMSTALEGYNALLNDVENLKNGDEYTYHCTGVNDNLQISNIVKAFLNGTGYDSLRLNVVGSIGMHVPAKGDGSVSNPYGWFDFNVSSTRKVIVDFTRCSAIIPVITGGTSNHIFYANYGIHVIGANLITNNTSAGTVIRVISTNTGAVKFDDCRFWITAYQDSLIATRGTFNNCRGSVANSINNSYCFMPKGNILKINGGEYYAYTGDSSVQSAVLGHSDSESVSILYGVSCPTLSRSGYYQTHCIIQFAGSGALSCTDIISALEMSVISGISNIRGIIAKSKPDIV